jgi:hypothetical protein
MDQKRTFRQAQDVALTRSKLTTPRAAAVAGILFSVLLITSLAIIRLSIPADPLDAGHWLAGDRRPIDLALNLLQFAGIAFLWFIGVVRDRLGEPEDRLYLCRSSRRGCDEFHAISSPYQEAWR